MRVKVLKFFKFAKDGIHIHEFHPGSIDMDGEIAKLALQNGWAKKIAPKRAKSKASDPKPLRKKKS